MLWHRWFLSVKGKRISESSKQEGIVLGWNLSAISALQRGSCKCKRYQRLTREKVGRGAAERWQWKLFGGHNNRSYCYCKAWGFSYLFLFLVLYLSASIWPLKLQSISVQKIYSCSGFAATFPAGEDFFHLYNFSHGAKRLKLSIDRVDLTCSSDLHQYFHSSYALIFSQTLSSDVEKDKYFSAHLQSGT